MRQRVRIDLAQFQRDLQVQQRIVCAPDVALGAGAERLEHLQVAEAKLVRGWRLRRNRADLQMAEALRELLDFAQAAERARVSLAANVAPVDRLLVGNARRPLRSARSSPSRSRPSPVWPCWRLLSAGMRWPRARPRSSIWTLTSGERQANIRAALAAFRRRAFDNSTIARATMTRTASGVLSTSAAISG